MHMDKPWINILDYNARWKLNVMQMRCRNKSKNQISSVVRGLWRAIASLKIFFTRPLPLPPKNYSLIWPPCESTPNMLNTISAHTGPRGSTINPQLFWLAFPGLYCFPAGPTSPHPNNFSPGWNDWKTFRESFSLLIYITLQILVCVKLNT